MRSEIGSVGQGGSFIEAARRAQIMQAAVVTVDEVGYHRASLAQIGRRAGIAKSAIAYYFGSRERLLLDVVGGVFAALGEAVLGAVRRHDDPVEQFIAYCTAYLEHIDMHRQEMAAAVEIAVSHRGDDGIPLYLAETDEDTALLRSILEGAMRAGRFRSLSADFAASAVTSVLDRTITLVQRDRGIELGEHRAETVRFLLDALRVDRAA